MAGLRSAVRLSLVIACTLVVAPRVAQGGLLGGLLGGSAPPSCTPLTCGTFASPFAEPTIGGQATTAKCITDAGGQPLCKPAAGSVALLADGRVLYWDALEGTERVQFSVVLEYGPDAGNDQSRVLTLGPGDVPTWTQPSPPDAGANPGGTQNTPLLPGLNTNDEQGAGALFCADLVPKPAPGEC